MIIASFVLLYLYAGFTVAYSIIFFERIGYALDKERFPKKITPAAFCVLVLAWVFVLPIWIHYAMKGD